MKREIKGVIFDLDNTLIDSSSMIKNADSAILEEMKRDFKQINEELFRDILSKTDEEFKAVPYKERYGKLFYEIFGRLSGLEFGRGHTERYSSIFEEYLFNRFEFTEGAEETIKRLKEAGLRIGLLTGEGMYPGSKKNTLNNIDFMRHFDITVIAKESIDESKKDVKAFIKTASLMDLRPEEILFVGDVPELDIDNAKKAGMLTVLFDKYNGEKRRKSTFEPDYAVDDMRELYSILNINA